jgi:hypothetical protein
MAPNGSPRTGGKRKNYFITLKNGAIQCRTMELLKNGVSPSPGLWWDAKGD